MHKDRTVCCNTCTIFYWHSYSCSLWRKTNIVSSY